MSARANDVGIPLCVRDLDRWLTWRRDRKHPRARLTRIPDGSTNDGPFATWRDVQLVELSNDRGVGLTFSGGVQLADGTWLSALDLDACVRPDGTLTPWAAQIVEAFGRSYTEQSPSGTGLRILARTRERPDDARQGTVYVADGEPLDGCDHRPQVQTFTHSGYVTLTGQRIDGVASEPLLVDSDALSYADAAYGDATRAGGVEVDTLPTIDSPPTLDEVAATIEKLPNGPAMLAGAWLALDFPSASELWWKLCNATVRAARGDGPTAVRFLLTRTAFGRGDVDSADPDKYQREGWVAADVLRAIGKGGHHTTDALFDELPPDPAAPADPAAATAEGKRSRARTLDDLLDESETLDDWLVHDVLPRTGLGVFYGSPGAGKTPAVLSLATRVARSPGDVLLGEAATWLGHDLDTGDDAAVLLIAGEDVNGTKRRLIAQQLVDRDGAEVPRGVPIVRVPRTNMTDEPSVMAMLREADERLAQLVADTGRELRFVLVIVDTLAANFGGRDENDTQSMSTFVDACQGIAQRRGALVLVVHHPTKDGRSMRGNSALLGAADAIYRVEQERRTRVVELKPEKVKSAADDGPPLRGKLRPIEVGRDRRDRPVTAVTLTDLAGAFDDVAAPPPPEAWGDLRKKDRDPMLRVLAALASIDPRKGEAVSEGTLSERTGFGSGKVRRLLRVATERHWIRTDAATGSQPPVRWLLPDCPVQRPERPPETAR